MCTQFIDTQLVKEGKTTTATREKLAFKKEDLRYAQKGLWTEPDHGDRRTGRDRVMSTAVLHAFCGTGARVGGLLPAHADQASLDRTVQHRLARAEETMHRASSKVQEHYTQALQHAEHPLAGLRYRVRTLKTLQACPLTVLRILSAGSSDPTLASFSR